MRDGLFDGLGIGERQPRAELLLLLGRGRSQRFFDRPLLLLHNGHDDDVVGAEQPQDGRVVIHNENMFFIHSLSPL